MLKKVYIYLLLQALLVATGSVFAQTFPVTVSTNITPPYSTYLGDYVAPGSQKLALNIFVNDLNRPELQTRLRLRIEGQGILIETKPEFLPQPLLLQGGVPERLIASDLAPYFSAQNLNFNGITRQQFERTGQLPEGLYSICFEVLEYNRGAKVSNSGCTMAWLILNDPPMINLPRQNEKLRPQQPQYVTFQWTPRHTGSPNSAFSTEYEFTLVELWPENRNPNDAILTSPPIYQTTTQSTTLIYGPAQTPLEPGRRYAFQVKAKSITGVNELDLFKNQGRSVVHSFQYGDACEIPANIRASASSSGAFKITYESNFNNTAFSVRYRKANDPQARWFEEDSYLEALEINGLQAETTYEYQVTAGCGPFNSEYSAVAQVTTDAMPEVTYACGLPPEDFDFGNNEPLPALQKDDILYAGDFNVKISEATGSAGTFTGKGTVVVPYLDNLAVSVEFASISVNTDYRMTAGSMDVKGVGVDVLPDDFTDFLDKLDETIASVDEVLDDVSDGLDVADEILDEVGDLANDILDNGPFTDEEEEEMEDFTVEQYEEAAEEAVGAAASALSGGANTQNISDAARQLAKATALKNRANKLQNIHNNSDTLNIRAVEFHENLSQFNGNKMGFDAKEHNAHRLHYNIMVLPDGNVAVPWVATRAGETGSVKAQFLANESIDKENILFKSGADGANLDAQLDGNEWTVSLPAVSKDQPLVINAVDDEGATVGKLNAIGYEEIKRKVHIVPVGSSTANFTGAELTNYLNRIYAQAGASWEVEMEEAITAEGYDGTLQDDEQQMLSTYSEGMKAIIKAYKNKDNISIVDNEFYLFLVDKSQTGKSGYMPRKHQYGFIYMGESGDKQRTIAHELGHGAFRLQHPWEEYPTIAEGSTDNLMDYGSGTKLRKYQWDLIHNPPVVVGLVEDLEEGGELGKSIQHCITAEMINKLNGNYFFDPAGNPVDLEEANPRSFYAVEEPDIELVGRLASFEKDGNIYKAYVSKGEFIGYGYDPEKRQKINSQEFEDIVYTLKNGSNSLGQLVKINENCSYIVATGSDSKDYDDVVEDCNCADGRDLNGLCEAGKEYFEDYKVITTSELELEYLFKVAELICEPETDELIVAQEAQYRKYESRAKSISEIISGNSFSFAKYYGALLSLKKWRDDGLSNIPNDAAGDEKDEIREKLFDIAYQLEPKVLALVPLERKVQMLTYMLDGSLYNLFTVNHDALVVKLIKSIDEIEADEFLDILASAKFKNTKEEPLIYQLKEKLGDFLNNDSPYTGFFKELRRLSDARNSLSGEQLDVKAYVKWDVEQQDYILLSFVKNRNNFTFEYNEDDHSTSIKTCRKQGRRFVYTGNSGYYEDYCLEEEYLLEPGSSPFDLVGLTIINDVSPLGSDCKDGVGANEYCGEIQIVPALFLDYLNEKETSQQLSNFGWNTFNVVITVTTFGEGAAAISAIRGAAAGQRLYVAGKHSYTLLDFTYTVTDLALKAANVETPAAWNWIGYAFAAKSSYDLIKNGGAKGIGFLKKLISEGKTDDAVEIVKEMGVTKSGKNLTADEVTEFVNKSESKILNSNNPELKEEFTKGLSAAGLAKGKTWQQVLNQAIEVLDEAPVGYQFYKRNGKDWIRRLDAGDPNTPRLTVKDGVIVKYDLSDIELELLAKIPSNSSLRSWLETFENPDLITKLNKLEGEQLTKLEADLFSENAHVLKEVFRSNPDLLDGWKVLGNADVNASIKTSPEALARTNRYLDNGLVIEGGVVIQADGTVLGKLDNNDVYNPGELKVKGKHSGRHFDPDDAGGPIVKKTWTNANIDSDGIKEVEKHLDRFGADPDNAEMIERLKKIQLGEITATDFDKRFYTHELEEYARYKNKGIPDGENNEDFYYNAHAASLESYSIDEADEPLYYYED